MKERRKEWAESVELHSCNVDAFVNVHFFVAFVRVGQRSCGLLYN